MNAIVMYRSLFVLASLLHLGLYHARPVRLFGHPLTRSSPAPYDLYGVVARAADSDFLIPPPDRDHIGDLLEALGSFRVGVELGVQKGQYAKTILSAWPSCQRYYLVDLWHHQENYEDDANRNDSIHELFMSIARQNLQQFSHKTIFLRNSTLEAASLVQEPVDFVYVDARHDYCGVKDDLTAWWPKLRGGGILAGHDYRAAHEVTGQDWAKCSDGTIHPYAVKGAVNEFVLQHGLHLSVTYLDKPYNSWMVRKRRGSQETTAPLPAS